MSYERKPDSFSAFKNTRKTTDKHPVLTGTALVDGVEYFVDIWFNQDRNGDRYASGTFKRKDKQPQAGKPQQSYRDQSGGYGNQPNDLDDRDLPF